MNILKDTENLEKLESIISKLLENTNNKAYIVGSTVLDKPEPNDVDVTISFSRPINIEELRATSRYIIKATKGLPYKINRHYVLDKDNTDAEELPFYNLQKGTKKIYPVEEDWKTYTKHEFFKKVREDTLDFNEIKGNPFLEIKYYQVQKLKNKNFFTESVIREKIDTEYTNKLNDLLKSDDFKKNTGENK